MTKASAEQNIAYISNLISNVRLFLFFSHVFLIELFLLLYVDKFISSLKINYICRKMELDIQYTQY